MTGVGPGDSLGKWKCANQCGGCGCRCQENPPPVIPPKQYCKVQYSAGGSVSITAGSSNSITACT